MTLISEMTEIQRFSDVGTEFCVLNHREPQLRCPRCDLRIQRFGEVGIAFTFLILRGRCLIQRFSFGQSSSRRRSHASR
jgi:hypothetical protein